MSVNCLIILDLPVWTSQTCLCELLWYLCRMLWYLHGRLWVAVVSAWDALVSESFAALSACVGSCGCCGICVGCCGNKVGVSNLWHCWTQTMDLMRSLGSLKSDSSIKTDKICTNLIIIAFETTSECGLDPICKNSYFIWSIQTTENQSGYNLGITRIRIRFGLTV